MDSIVRIRDATSGDAAACAAIYAPYVTSTVISFEETPPGAATMAERMRSVGDGHAWLVATEDDAIVGYAYSHAFAARPAYRWSCETSIYLDTEHRGHGVGRTLYRELLRRCRERGYRRILAGVTQPNAASMGLHAAFGFREVGRYRRIGWKLGAWHDVVWLELELEGEDPPREPGSEQTG